VKRPARYAASTSVPIHRSRAEIDAYLERVGAKDITWASRTLGVSLCFTLPPLDLDNGPRLPIRYDLAIPANEVLLKQASQGRRKPLTQRQIDTILSARGKREHRLLLLWVKGMVELHLEGLHDITTQLLPWVVGPGGETLGQAIEARLANGQLALGPGQG
jgi:hypothetical protein